MKIYVVGGYNDYASWIPNATLVGSVAEADLVLFCGGTDVDSALYGEPRHPAAQMPDVERDRREVAVFKEAVALGKHLLGICRGAQFLCVMAGGKLIQDQPNTGRHKIMAVLPGEDMDNYYGLMVVSDHHQAQYPWGLPESDFKLLGYTYSEPGYPGVEDAYYPKTKALAIQSHPEWLDPHVPDEARTLAHYRKLLELHLSDKL